MTDELYDIIIVGAGPAGMTAGVYTARKNLKTLILTRDVGGQASLSNDIENYLGFSMITGAELVKKFEKHLEQFSDWVSLHLLNDGVNKLTSIDDGFELGTADGQKFRARAVIIASGRVPAKLGVDGEERLLNHGVSYCAWCDGPIFRDKEVVVVGGGNSALDAALAMKNFVKQLYIVNNGLSLTGDQIMIDKVKDASNVRIVNHAQLKSINGERFVESVTVEDMEVGLEKVLDCQGVFIEIGSVPATDYLKGVLELSQSGEIVIDAHNQTSLAGVFGAGDVTTVNQKQIVISAGEGAKAGIAASLYLARRA